MKFNLFSQREGRKKGQYPTAPSVRSFSKHLRRNIVDIFREVLGAYEEPHPFAMGVLERVETNSLWVDFDRLMQRNSPEYSDWAYKKDDDDPASRILNYVLNASDAGVLDLLDVGAFFLEQVVPKFQERYSYALGRWNVKLSAASAREEIDIRLRDAGTVYRVANGTIINSTDDFTHEDIVVPALRVLGEAGFENALKEFHGALDAYRKGEFDNVLTKANHAFESTMKIIAGKMRWQYDEKATAAPMIDLLVKNGLLPEIRKDAMNRMVEMMKWDLPRLRNSMPGAGHGAGEKNSDIPEQFATYAISATAANIRLLIDSYAAKRPKKN